jgi:prevent-host-death family protein
MTNEGVIMKGQSVSVAEGKKSFSRLIEGAISKKEDVIITRRGKPVAVIVPYDEYLKSRKQDALQVIMETRKVFRSAGISGEQVAKEARKELEKRL